MGVWKPFSGSVPRNCRTEHLKAQPAAPRDSPGLSPSGPRLNRSSSLPRWPRSSPPPFLTGLGGAPVSGCGLRLPEAAGWALVHYDRCPYKKRRGHQVALCLVWAQHSYYYTFQFLLWVWFLCFERFPSLWAQIFKKKRIKTPFAGGLSKCPCDVACRP